MPAKPLSPEQLADAARLREVFQHAKTLNPALTQAQLAYECGWNTQGTVSQYLLGRIPLNLDALLKFCVALQVSPERISPMLAERLYSVSLILRNTQLNEVPAPYASDADGPAPRQRKGHRKGGSGLLDLPVLSARDGLEAGVFDRPGEATESMTLRVERLRRFGAGDGGHLAVLSAHDDTMSDTIDEGDLLLVDFSVDRAELDAVYVLALNGAIYIKRLQHRPDGSLLLISDNKRYEPYPIQAGEGDALRILGRVLFVWRIHKL